MNIKSFRSNKLFLIIVLLYINSTNAVYAASCFVDGEINSVDDPKQFLIFISDVVFVGKVLAIWKENFESIEQSNKVLSQKTLFSIESFEKGSLKLGQDLIVEGNVNICNCIKEYSIGESYIVFANYKNLDTKEVLITKHCNFIKKIENK